MTSDEVLDQVRELLQRKTRLSYQALKLRFNIDDPFLGGLKGELIKAERVAADEDGEVLVWVGEEGKGETGKRGNGKGEVVSPRLAVASPQPPSSYTPAHLAERI